MLSPPFVGERKIEAAIVGVSAVSNKSWSPFNSHVPATPLWRGGIGSSMLGKSLLSGTAWAFSGRVFLSVSALLLNVLLARLLSPAELGKYLLLFAFVSCATVFCQLGMAQAVVRFVSAALSERKLGRARSSVTSIFLSVTTVCVVVAILIYVKGGVFVRGLFDFDIGRGMAAAVAMWVSVSALQGLIAETFRGFNEISYATLFGGVISGALSIVALFLILVSRGVLSLYGVLIIIAGSMVVSGAIGAMALGKKVSTLENSGRVGLGEVLHLALPIFATNLFVFFLNYADLWILGMFLGTEDVAVYGVACRLAVIISLPLSIVNAVVPPVIVEMYTHRNYSALETLLRNVATVAAVPSLVVTAVFILFGPIVLRVTFGDYYVAGATVLAVLSVGQMANVWTGSCGYVLMMTGGQNALMWITVVCGACYVAVAFVVARNYGVFGLSACRAAVFALQNLLALLLVRKSLGIWTHARFRLPTFHL
jgi:O-antigen/teichoic acid export membrane protein